ncbi:hypothetical protein ACROYT_G041715 [Oculina patagonica]
MGVDREKFKNMGNSSIGCGGQNSLKEFSAKKPENRKFVRRKSELPHDSSTVNALSDYHSPEEYLTTAPET